MRIHRVLLIQPPYNCAVTRADLTPNAPLGIAYVAAVLEKSGYQVEVLDAFVEGWDQDTSVNPEILRVGLPFDTIKEIIAERAPDVVGITCMFTSQRGNAHRVAALAKEVDPSIVVIMGGAHVTAAPEMVLADPNVDVTVLGEGEEVVVPLLERLEAGVDLNGQPGIGYRRDDGRCVVSREPGHVSDLDALPLPARHLLPMEKYFDLESRHGGPKRRTRPAAIVSSRGCQYHCNFCTAFRVFGRVPRWRSVPNILAELDELVNVYKIDELYFEDDQLLAKRAHAEELLDAMAARRYDLVWDTPNGVSPWLLNDSILAKMKAAGCYRVNLAVESGNQWVLDNIVNKPVKVDRIPELVALIRKHGIEPGMFLVLGNVGEKAIETKEQMRDSFRLARRAGINPFVSLLTPYPGSEVLTVAESKGYLVPGFSWDNLVIGRGNLRTPEWGPEDLLQLLAEEQAQTLLSSFRQRPLWALGVVWRNMAQQPAAFPKRVLKYSAKLVRSYTS